MGVFSYGMEGKPPPPPPPISIDKLSRLFVTRREIEWRASRRRRKVSQSLGGRIRVVGLASGEERGSSCGTVSPRGGERVVGESNQPDRSSCFRSFVRSFPPSPAPSPSAFLFFPRRTLPLRDNRYLARGWRETRGRERERGGGGRRGWRLIFCSLASASSSRRNQPGQRVGEGYHPSSRPPFVFRSRSQPSPSFLPFSLSPLVYTPTPVPSLLFSSFHLFPSSFEGRRDRLLFRVKGFCVSQRVGATS